MRGTHQEWLEAGLLGWAGFSLESTGGVLNVLAFFAHPDDETMLSGGTIALLNRLGARVTVLCATRGEGGETGEPSLCTRAELGAVREKELRCAVETLGAAGLLLMEYIDPTVGPDDQLFPFTDNEDRLAEEIAGAVRSTRAQVLLTHGSNGEYGHPAHQLCHRAAQKACETVGDPALLLYTIQGAYPEHPHPRLMNANDPAHLVLDCSIVNDEKTLAALCHRTQHALFVRRRTEELGRPVTVPEVIHSEESLHRALPPAPSGLPLQDTLAALLRSSGLSRDILV
jgi:LmbE family N-acetylglucosaminyl deacetylase